MEGGREGEEDNMKVSQSYIGNKFGLSCVHTNH